MEDYKKNLIDDRSDNKLGDKLDDKLDDISVDISLDNLINCTFGKIKIWNPNYLLSKASIIQIILTFLNIRNRPIRNKKNKLSVYQKELNNRLIPIIDELLLSFKKCLVWSNEYEKQVIIYNLLGLLPKNVSIIIDGYDERLKFVNIGNLIKALKQRLNFIIERSIPISYNVNDEYIKSFVHLQEIVKTFLLDVITFEESFIEANDKSHKLQQNFYKKK